MANLLYGRLRNGAVFLFAGEGFVDGSLNKN
jgi:hypothetical protein